MAIRVNLDLLLVKNKLKSNEVARLIGITEQNLSILKTGRAKAIRFSTLNEICRVLKCQPGAILEFVEEDKENEHEAGPVPPD